MLLDEEKKFANEFVRELEDGEVLFSEGDESREMYVVKAGQIIVTKKSKDSEVVLATLRKGDFVGDMALLESLPRSATARAKGHAKLLALQPGGFLLKIRRDPTFAFEMLQKLSARLRLTNQKLLHLLDNGQVTSESVRKIVEGSEFNLVDKS